MKIQKQIAELRSYLADAETVTPRVSAWSVALQIQHLALAMSAISKALINSIPPKPSPKRSLIKTLIFLSGRIPRGKGKAPELSVPKESVSAEDLVRLLAEAEEKVAQASSLDNNAWFEHPYFGPLNCRQSLRFIEIHNEHHLKIIREILE